MRVRIFPIIIFTLIGFSGWSQQSFNDAVNAVISQPEYKNASVGIDVRDLKTGQTVFKFNAERDLIPASTMKLVTSATALELLGAGYRFETEIGYTGKTEKSKVLNGDLVVIGGADPVLGSNYFADYYFTDNFFDVWARKIKAAGIEQIEGDLILDGSVYDNEKIPATWVWEDIANYYGAGPNAFTVYDNLFHITFKSPRKAGKATKIISMWPDINGLEIKNEVLSADNNSDLAYVFGGPFDKKRVVRGTIPRNRRAFTIKAAVHHPEEIVANEFLKHLASAGVFISGKVKFEKVDRNDFQTVYIQQSPTLAEIIKVLNYESVNLIAEHLLKQLAVEKNGVGNREAGIEIVKEFWQSKGISTDYFFMEDGSGLSHFNLVSPHFFTSILKYMVTKSSNKSTFVNSLPGAGDGTLTRFDRDVFGDSLHAKSGSMTRVRCYSGYLKTDSGNDIIFSIMFNHFLGSHSKLVGEIEALLHALKSSN
jgi:D-alanyl-D-alanine carboxypeptidase/D-alanyl-D-alanine-endopeptidase (penicillin-binding protein 4)